MMDLLSPLPTCTTLLPLLLSSEPTPLPSSLLSSTTIQSHHFLNTRPGEEGYLQPVKVKPEVTRLYTRLVEGNSIDELQLHAPSYSIDPLDGIRAQILLGPQPGLALQLKWEEASLPTAAFAPPSAADDEHERPAWTFLSLDLAQGEEVWSRTLEEALKKGAERGGKRPNMTIPTKAPPKTREEMAEGEGTTPGAYGAPEDFWDGWGSDGDDGDRDDEVAAVPMMTPDEEERTAEGYWDSYGQVESQVGEVEEVEVGAPKSTVVEATLDDDDEDEDEDGTPPSSAGDASRPRSVTRSRRSSTIRAPVSPVILAESRSQQGYFTSISSASATPQPNAYLFPAHPSPNPAGGLLDHSPSIPTEVPSTTTNGDPFLSSSTATPATTSHPAAFTLASSLADAGPTKEDEALQSALAGVWQLYSSGAEATEERREKWLRIAQEVSQKQ